MRALAIDSERRKQDIEARNTERERAEQIHAGHRTRLNLPEPSFRHRGVLKREDLE